MSPTNLLCGWRLLPLWRCHRVGELLSDSRWQHMMAMAPPHSRDLLSQVFSNDTKKKQSKLHGPCKKSWFEDLINGCDEKHRFVFKSLETLSSQRYFQRVKRLGVVEPIPAIPKKPFSAHGIRKLSTEMQPGFAKFQGGVPWLWTWGIS